MKNMYEKYVGLLFFITVQAIREMKTVQLSLK